MATNNKIAGFEAHKTSGLEERHTCGSSRVGVRNSGIDLLPLPPQNYGMRSVHYSIGSRTYELSNQLPSVLPSAVGNLLSVISDKVIPEFPYTNAISEMRADIRVARDYSPFGVELDGRTFNSSLSRFGFNGKEKDDEIKGSGNSYDFGARMYDPRLGRWLTIDPHSSKYPNLSPYNFVANSPILFIDPDGKDIGLNKLLKEQGKNRTALEIARYSTIFNDCIEHFGSTNSGDFKTDKEGILSKHLLQLNAGGTAQNGETQIYVDINGKWEVYDPEKYSLDENSKVKFEVSVANFSVKSDIEIGYSAANLSHEVLVHVEEYAELLVTFEKALIEANGDKLKIDNAVVELNKGMKEIYLKNSENANANGQNSSTAHQNMLKGETNLDEALDEIITELDTKIEGANNSSEKKMHSKRKEGVQIAKKEDIKKK